MVEVGNTAAYLPLLTIAFQFFHTGVEYSLCHTAGSLLSPGDPHGLIYTPYADYTNYAALAASPLLTEYATADHSGGLFAR